MAAAPSDMGLPFRFAMLASADRCPGVAFRSLSAQTLAWWPRRRGLHRFSAQMGPSHPATPPERVRKVLRAPVIWRSARPAPAIPNPVIACPAFCRFLQETPSPTRLYLKAILKIQILSSGNKSIVVVFAGALVFSPREYRSPLSVTPCGRFTKRLQVGFRLVTGDRRCRPQPIWRD